MLSNRPHRNAIERRGDGHIASLTSVFQVKGFPAILYPVVIQVDNVINARYSLRPRKSTEVIGVRERTNERNLSCLQPSFARLLPRSRLFSPLLVD
jgi:hypothetical protein